jgi:hypothetical protein
MVLQPKSNLGGYPLILGRSWLDIIEAFIIYRSWDMTISHGSSTKRITLYLDAKPSSNLDNSPLFEGNDEETTQSIFNLNQKFNFREETEDDFNCTYTEQPHIANHSPLENSFGKNS